MLEQPIFSTDCSSIQFYNSFCDLWDTIPCYWPPQSSDRTCVTHGIPYHIIGHHYNSSLRKQRIFVGTASILSIYHSVLATKRYYFISSFCVSGSAMELYINVLVVLNSLFNSFTCWRSLVLTTEPHKLLIICTL